MQVCENVKKTVTEVFEEYIEKFIEKVDEVCEDLPWPLDWFCHAVTFLIKIVERVVKVVVTVYVVVVCYFVAAIVTLLALVGQVMLMLPIIGPIVKWWIGALVWTWSQFVGLMDAGAGLIGIRPIKHLRLEVIILMRANLTPTATPAGIAPVLAFTEATYRSRADVKIHTEIHTVTTPSPSGALTIGTEIDPLVGVLGEDGSEAGLYFQKTITEMLVEQDPWFLIRVGAPLVVFVVDEVEGSYNGCSAGPLVDYICLEGRALTPTNNTLAHEIGHACGLPHDAVVACETGDVTNLMYCRFTSPSTGAQRGTNLSPLQRAILRSSPHVTYV